MVGWLYIGETLAAPIRLLEVDTLNGLFTIEIAAKFVPYRSELRGKTIVEFRDWKRRREVRCLGAEKVGTSLMIEAVDLGLANPSQDERTPGQGKAEDWLIVDGKACCQVTGVKIGTAPGSLSGHCMFNVPLEDWRDLRIGEGAVLAGVGISYEDVEPNDASITPMLHAARDLSYSSHKPKVELVRLRERMRYIITPIATDWSDESTRVVSRVLEADSLGTKSQEPAQDPVHAPMLG